MGLKWFHEHKLFVIPSSNKKPLIPWAKYKNVFFDEINHTFILQEIKKHEPCNYSVMCGYPSNGLIVIDFDSVKVGDRIVKTGETLFHEVFNKWRSLLEKTLIVRTGGLGIHIYLRLTEKDIKENMEKVKNITRIADNIPIDIKGYGGLVVAPGSIHQSGRRYEIISSTDEIMKISYDALIEFIDKIGKADDKKDTDKNKMLSNTNTKIPYALEFMINAGTKEGNRNKARFHLFRELLKNHINFEIIRQKILEFNKNCNPPAPVEEVERHVDYMIKNIPTIKQYLRQDEMNPPEELYEDIHKISILKSGDKAVYIFIFKDKEKIIINDTNMITPREFEIKYLNIRRKLLKMSTNEWKEFVNMLISDDSKVSNEGDEEYNLFTEIKEDILETIRYADAYKYSNKKKMDKHNILVDEESNKVYVPTSILKRYAEREFRNEYNVIRILLIDYLDGPTQVIRIGKDHQPTRMTVFKLNKVFSSLDEINYVDEDEEDEDEGDMYDEGNN